MVHEIFDQLPECQMPKTAAGWLQLGLECNRKSTKADKQKAYSCFRTALEDPTGLKKRARRTAELYFGGLILGQRHDFNRGTTHLKTALALGASPVRVASWYLTAANQALEEERYLFAQQCFLQYQELHPGCSAQDRITVNFGIGVCCLQADDLSAANIAFDTTFALQPTWDMARQIAMAYWQRGEELIRAGSYIPMVFDCCLYIVQNRCLQEALQTSTSFVSFAETPLVEDVLMLAYLVCAVGFLEKQPDIAQEYFAKAMMRILLPDQARDATAFLVSVVKDKTKEGGRALMCQLVLDSKVLRGALSVEDLQQVHLWAFYSLLLENKISSALVSLDLWLKRVDFESRLEPGSASEIEKKGAALSLGQAGIDLVKAKKFALAQECLEALLQRPILVAALPDPNATKVQIWLLDCYFGLHEFDALEKLVQELLGKNEPGFPSHLGALYNQQVAQFYGRKEYALAKICLKAMLNTPAIKAVIQPNEVPAFYINLAMCHVYLHEFEFADQAFDQSIAHGLSSQGAYRACSLLWKEYSSSFERRDYITANYCLVTQLRRESLRAGLVQEPATYLLALLYFGRLLLLIHTDDTFLLPDEQQAVIYWVKLLKNPQAKKDAAFLFQQAEATFASRGLILQAQAVATTGKAIPLNWKPNSMKQFLKPAPPPSKPKRKPRWRKW